MFYMVLWFLFLLRPVCASCGLLSSGLFGLAVSLLPILAGCLLCWMVRLGVTLRFVLSGFGSVCFVGILLTDLVIKRLLGHAADGCPGHGPAHLLIESAAEIGFVWSAEEVGWVREGCRS